MFGNIDRDGEMLPAQQSVPQSAELSNQELEAIVAGKVRSPGGIGGPASGLGVRPGVGVGAPGFGMRRGPG